jgi:two-component system, chemotaxis family, sensor kinase CheA
MFISVKRHKREILDLLGSSNRLTDALLKGSAQGLFLLDAKDKILPQVSASMATLFRRQEFQNLSMERLVGPLVSAKTLTATRVFMTRLLDPAAANEALDSSPLQDVEVRLLNPDGSFDSAHYEFDFSPVDLPREPRAWLVRVSDITTRVQQLRELEDLRTQAKTHGEILRGVLQGGGARFGAFLERTDASMKTINDVLKKPAREADAFRSKLEETLHEVDRVRRDAAALKLTGLETAARSMEDALQELRSRGAASGSDFLPLAVKLDQLYGQFAQMRSLTSQASPAREPDEAAPEARVTESGTQIIEAPRFIADMEQRAMQQQAKPQRMAQAGSLDSTLLALTEHIAQEHRKTVVLECTGVQLIPPDYQATIKNIAIQLIRNAVMHGVETPAVRQAAGKAPHGTLRLDFKEMPDQSYELHFQDDGSGLDAEKVRATAIARGLITEDDAARLRDRQAIKLIFKSGYTTLDAEADAAPHGTGMSVVRRYVHQAGGKIAIATLPGHETRFKVTMPAVAAEDSQVA